MKNQALQKELLEKVKPGTKPSHLKKSKSTSDLPTQTKDNLPKRKSLENLTIPKSLKVQLTEAHDEISILELKLETQARELTELNNLSEENQHLKKQATIKQQQMEQLTQQLEETNLKLTQIKQELDNSLEARHQNLKDFQKEHLRNKNSQKELTENNIAIEEAVEELTSQDQRIKDLRTKLFQSQQRIDSLQREVSLAKIKRNVVYMNNNEFSSSITYFQYALYALFTIWFCLLLKRRSNG